MRLQWVNVSGEGVEFLLGNSPFLEELSITFSEKLTAFKIIGPSLVLKRLEIINCKLSAVEIHDVNLEFLMYHGPILQQFVLKNVPIVEMHLGGELLFHMKDLLLMFSSYLPQFEKFTIGASNTSFMNEEEVMMFYNNVKMSNLHQLIVKYYRERDVMLFVAYLIRASPLLQSFVLEAYGGTKREDMLYFRNILPVKLRSYKYPHLKRVELIGYRGTLFKLSLAVHFLENGSALKQFIVDLRKRVNAHSVENYLWPNSVNGRYPSGEEHEVNNAVKDHVKEQLLKRLPSTLKHLNLCIL